MIAFSTIFQLCLAWVAVKIFVNEGGDGWDVFYTFIGISVLSYLVYVKDFLYFFLNRFFQEDRLVLETAIRLKENEFPVPNEFTTDPQYYFEDVVNNSAHQEKTKILAAAYLTELQVLFNLGMLGKAYIHTRMLRRALERYANSPNLL